VQRALGRETMTKTPVNVEVSSPASAAEWIDLRRYERYETNWPARCHAADGRIWNVTIVDASSGGFGLSCDLPLPKFTDLTIIIEDVGMLRCTLVWKGKNGSGLKLHYPVDTLSKDQMSGMALGLKGIGRGPH
jgi:PilZ domain